jgi:gamma-glutamyltranspeptidase/glutathione hydrolase
MKKYLIVSVLLASQLSWAQFKDFNIVKEVQVKNKGVVVSAHPLASEAGAKILKNGWKRL